MIKTLFLLVLFSQSGFNTNANAKSLSQLNSELPQAEALYANNEASQVMGLDALIKKAKSQNYDVQQEAEKVFQARKRVQAAIANLLPHINMGGVLSIAISGPSSIFSLVGNLLPFIFPSNWYQMKATRRLSMAETKSFASMRGNEVFDVESLYYSLSRDLQLAGLVDAHIAWLDQIVSRLRAEEIAGTLPAGSADYFNLNNLRLKEERSTLSELLSTERAAILYDVALDPADQNQQILAGSLPDLSNAQAVSVESYLKVAQDRSLEIQTLDWMIDAAYYTRRAVMFAFLDPSSDQSIGFGMAFPVQIARSQQNELIIRKDSTKSLIAQKVSDTVNLNNQSIVRFQLAKQGSGASRAELVRLIQRHDSGDLTLDPKIFITELGRLQEEVLSFEVKKISEGSRYLNAKARLNRLTLDGYYNDLEDDSSDNQSNQMMLGVQ